MKHADMHSLLADLHSVVQQRHRGSDHSCRPRRCPVCSQRAVERDEQARRERRQGRTFGPAPEGVDVFAGFRDAGDNVEPAGVGDAGRDSQPDFNRKG